MDPHPDFAEVALPRRAHRRGFQMTPLSPAEVDEDYAVVMQTAHLLSDAPGSWPNGLTLEENLADLAWHEREFTARRSFAWILRDSDGLYLGCFYIYPDLGKRHSARVVLWLRDRPDRRALAKMMKPDLTDWMAASLPEGIALRWECNPEV